MRVLAERFLLNPHVVRGFAREVYGVSDRLGDIRADVILGEGAGACAGTALVSGLSRHAAEQHSHVQALSAHFDDFGDQVRDAVHAFEQLDDDVPPALPNPRTG